MKGSKQHRKLNKRLAAFNTLKSAGQGTKPTDKWVPGVRGDHRYAMYHQPGSNKK